MASMHVSTAPQDRTVTVLAWMMFLIPAVGVPSELVLQDTLKSAVVAVGVLLAALAFFWARRGQTTALRWHAMVLLPFALMLYALGSMAWSHTYLAGVEACRWFLMGLLMWLGLNTLDRNNLAHLAWGVHAGVVVASLWAMLQFWVDLQWFPQVATPASTFANRNFFAEYAVSALPFSVMALAQSRRTRWLPVLALSVACVVVAILMTGTRSALLALLALLPVFGVVLLRYRRQLALWQWSSKDRWTVSMVLLLGVIGLGLVPSGNPAIALESHGITALQRSFARTASVAKSDEYTVGSFSVRALMWRSTARMLMDKPWTGVGAGAWEVNAPLYQNANEWLETDFFAHNEVLQFLGEYGLLVGGLGLAFLLAYGGLSARLTWLLKDSNATDAPARATALASLFGILIVGNAGFPLHLAPCGALMALCLGTLSASDGRLGIHEGVQARQFTVRPTILKFAVLAISAILIGVLSLSYRAMDAEAKIVRAIHLGNELLSDKDAPGADARDKHARMLQLTRESLRINPNYRNFTAMVAEQLERLGDLPNAAWVVESITATRPHVAGLRSGLAFTYSRLGQHEAAWRQYSELQRLRPQALGTKEVELVLLINAKRTTEAKEKLLAYFASGQYTQDMTELGYSVGISTKDWKLAIAALEHRSARWPQFAAEDNKMREAIDVQRKHQDSHKPDTPRQ